jgi:hypothetical protein
MKKLLFYLAIAVTIGGVMVACKKNNSTGGSSSTTDNASPAQVETQTDDEVQVDNEMDQAANDVNTAMNSDASVTGSATSSLDANTIATGAGGIGKIILNGLICDATITIDTSNGLRQITITYNGSNCWGNRIRTGTVVISIPVGVRWKDSGAVVTVSVDSLKIVRVRDQKTITLDGTWVYTNVTGGLLKDLATLGTITHTITADSVSIEFADSATRVWSVAKQRVFTYNDGVVITTTGTHSDGTNNNVSVWGTNRFGNSFETLIVQPMTIEQSCDYRLTSGETETIRPAVTTTVTYGLDSNGNPTSCPGNGYYYYKVVWVKDGKTYTFIGPY